MGKHSGRDRSTRAGNECVQPDLWSEQQFGKHHVTSPEGTVQGIGRRVAITASGSGEEREADVESGSGHQGSEAQKPLSHSR
jgi:hypothetical protein